MQPYIESKHSISDCRKPYKSLHPFIDEYIFRKINIPEGCLVEKTLPLHSECCIVFFLGNDCNSVNLHTQQSAPIVRCSIWGPQTQVLYSIRPKGTFISFIIKFRATGLYKLLGIPMNTFADKETPGKKVLNLPFEKITEQLLYAADIEQCIHIIEPYLLTLAEGCQTVPLAVDMVINNIATYPGLHTIEELAAKSCMSQRQLQRCFKKYMGIGPKMYCRISRFLKLLRAKENKPEQKWATLAQEFGYYDQMHFNKDFKQFMNSIPSAFVPTDFAF